MSTEFKDDDVGGAQRPSGVLAEGVDVIDQIARPEVDDAVGFGSSSFGPVEQAKMLKEADRSAVLLELIRQVRPYGVMSGPWMKWLEGGSFPVSVDLVKPVQNKQHASRLLDATDKAVSRALKKVDLAKADLRAAETEVEAIRAVNAASLQWVIVEQLADLMHGVFAMGPAWTVMRALSGHVPADTAAANSLTPAQLRASKLIHETRIKDTEMMMVSLDLWCGDADFEDALRFAIKRVVQDYQPKEAARVQSGVRRRSVKTVRTSMRPTTESEVAAVMDNLPLD